jgi:hypothetical protein
MYSIAGRAKVVEELALFFERRARGCIETELEESVRTDALAQPTAYVDIGSPDVLHLKVAAGIVAA